MINLIQTIILFSAWGIGSFVFIVYPIVKIYGWLYNRNIAAEMDTSEWVCFVILVAPFASLIFYYIFLN